MAAPFSRREMSAPAFPFGARWVVTPAGRRALELTDEFDQSQPPVCAWCGEDLLERDAVAAAGAGRCLHESCAREYDDLLGAADGADRLRDRDVDDGHDDRGPTGEGRKRRP